MDARGRRSFGIALPWLASVSSGLVGESLSPVAGQLLDCGDDSLGPSSRQPAALLGGQASKGGQELGVSCGPDR